MLPLSTHRRRGRVRGGAGPACGPSYPVRPATGSPRLYGQVTRRRPLGRPLPLPREPRGSGPPQAAIGRHGAGQCGWPDRWDLRTGPTGQAGRAADTGGVERAGGPAGLRATCMPAARAYVHSRPANKVVPAVYKYRRCGFLVDGPSVDTPLLQALTLLGAPGLRCAPHQIGQSLRPAPGRGGAVGREFRNRHYLQLACCCFRRGARYSQEPLNPDHREQGPTVRASPHTLQCTRAGSVLGSPRG